MTELLKRIRREIDKGCLVERLNKEGCKVKMTDAPTPIVIIDLDKPNSLLIRSETRCDYILVAEGHEFHWVAVLELKKGRLHADEVVRQLRAGSAKAMKLVPEGEAVRFRPIAVSGSKPKFERMKLRGKKIKFHGQSERVLLMSCGAKLATELRP